MQQISFNKVKNAEISELRNQYLRGLQEPRDGMWETFVDSADPYLIFEGTAVSGYFVLNSESQLLQFFVVNPKNAPAIFDKVLNTFAVKSATVTTSEPEFLALCMDSHKRIELNAVTYRIDDDEHVSNPEFPSDSELRPVKPAELNAAVQFGVAALGADSNWLNSYFDERIQKEELFGLWHEGMVIATGECRPSAWQNPYVDVGMVVAEQFRGQGIATNMLRQMVHLCFQRNLQAICSTGFDNVAAQRAIENAGFTSKHRILDVKF